MTTVLYADVLFVINFSMDFISLWVTSKLLSINRRTWRFALAAALGALAATAMTALSVEGVAEAAVALALSAAMALAAFGFGSARRLVGRALTLWGAGALIGGAVTALCSLGGGGLAGTPVGVGRPWGHIAVGVLLVWAFVRLIRPRLSRRTATVRLTAGGVSVDAEALVDTGDLACDPIGGDAAMFVSLPLASRLFGEENARSIAEVRPDALPEALHARVRLVPASGIGKTGMCAGIVVDSLTLPPDETPRRALVCVADVGKDHFGGFDALVPPSLL